MKTDLYPDWTALRIEHKEYKPYKPPQRFERTAC